jgi:hypothetical protein
MLTRRVSRICHDSVAVLIYASALSLLMGTLHGTVMRGPIAPVCRVGTPCSAPAKHITLYFTRNGTTRSTSTDGLGRYRLRLTAGVYSVKTNQRPFGVRTQPTRATVREGIDTRVNFHIDTGIR